ncbi:MAG: hypothetical protein AAB790_02230 [Patescibacteria group bacterium]
MYTLRLTFVLPLLALLLPAFAFAGSQSYTTPGTYTFTAPDYAGTLTVTINGAGGGGGGGGGGVQTWTYPQGGTGDTGSSGGTSSFGGSVVGNGGGGGQGGTGAAFDSEGGYFGTTGSDGGSGSASGGNSNTAGAGAGGGTGGTGGYSVVNDTPAQQLSVFGGTGGAGGSGGRSVKTYSTGTLASGTQVVIIVGAGGAGGTGGWATGWAAPGNAGSNGGSGSVTVTWTDAPTPPPSGLSCSVTFDQNPLTGESTTMHWTSTGAELFYINQVGWVGASGSAQVSQTGDYSGTVSGAGGTASCAATLNSPGGGSCTVTSRTCNPATKTVTDNCGNTTVCTSGCSTATSQCIVPSCPTGFVRSNGQCIRVVCEEGWTLSGSVCIPPPSVSFEPFDAIDRGGNPFRATGHLQAFPSLIPQGLTTRLYWKVSNARGCTVTGTNSDNWATLNSDPSGEISGEINSQTIYTLDCQALPGATPPTVRETVIVNILPVFEEI